jgi:hypothetical protein
VRSFAQYFLFFSPFFRKILLNMPLAERFQKIDSYLGAMVVSAKTLTRGADVVES